MIAEQERLGINWKNVAADADALGDNLDKIKLGFTGFSNGLFEVVAKDLIGATDELQKIDFVHLGEKVGQSILPVVREISGLVKGISEPGGFEHVGNAIRKALSDGATDIYTKIKQALSNTVAGRALSYIEKGGKYIAGGVKQGAAYLGDITSGITAKSTTDLFNRVGEGAGYYGQRASNFVGDLISDSYLQQALTYLMRTESNTKAAIQPVSATYLQ